MEVKLNPALLRVSVLLPLRNKILNGIIKEHSYKLPVVAFVGLTYIIIRKVKSAILQ